MKKLPISIDQVFFFFSPSIALPLVIRGIYFKQNRSLILFCLCYGLISFGFISPEGYDKSHYIYLYHTYQNMSVNDFFNSFLQQKTDFVFYTILYCIAWLGLPFEFFSFFITFITCYLIFSVFFKHSIANNEQRKKAFLFFTIVVLAISLPRLLSGMRNYLSVAFIFYGFNLLVNEKNEKKSLIFFFLGVITHFSSMLYIPVALMYYFLKRSSFIPKVFFTISLGFIFIPKSYLLNFLSAFNIFEVYSTSASIYLSENSYMENRIATGNLNNFIRIFIDNLWFYIALFFSILNIKNTSNKFVFFLLLMSFINIISSSLELLVRYALLAHIAFLLVLFFAENIKYRRFFILLMFIVNFSSFYFDINILSKALISSLYKIEYLTFPTIFLIDATTASGIK